VILDLAHVRLDVGVLLGEPRLVLALDLAGPPLDGGQLAGPLRRRER